MAEQTPWLENNCQRGKSPLATDTHFGGKDPVPVTNESTFGPPFIPEPAAFTSGPAHFISGPSIFTSGPSAFTSVKTVFTAGSPAFSTSAFPAGPMRTSSEHSAFMTNDNVALMSAFDTNPMGFASKQSAFTAGISIPAGSENLGPFSSGEKFPEYVVNEWNNQSKQMADPNSSSFLVSASQPSNPLVTGSGAFVMAANPTSITQEQPPQYSQQQPPPPPIIAPPPPSQQQRQQQQQQQFQNLITEGLERVMYGPQPIQTDPFGSIPFQSMTPTPNASPSLSPRRLRADSPFAKSLSPSPSPSPSHSPLFDAAATTTATTTTDNQLRSLDENFANMCLSTNASQLPTMPTAGVTAKAIPPPLPPPPPVPPSSAHHHHYHQQHHQYQSQYQQPQGTPQPSPSPPPPSQQQYSPHLPPPPRSLSHSPINVSPMLSPATIAVYQQQQLQQQQQQLQQQQQQQQAPSRHVTPAVFSFTSSPPSPSSDSSTTLASSVNDIDAWNPNFAGPNPNSLSPNISPTSSFSMLSTTTSASAGASSSASLGTSTFATKPRSASVRRYRRRADQELQEEMRPRTSSMPTKNTCRKPQLLGPPPWQADNDDLFVEPTEAGVTGVSGNYEPSNGQPGSGNSAFSSSGFYRLRSFATTSKGVVNRGDSLITNCSWVSPNNSISDYPSTSNSTYSLSSVQILKVFVLGTPGVGKASIIQQLMTSEYMGWNSTDSCEGK